MIGRAGWRPGASTKNHKFRATAPGWRRQCELMCSETRLPDIKDMQCHLNLQEGLEPNPLTSFPHPVRAQLGEAMSTKSGGLLCTSDRKRGRSDPWVLISVCIMDAGSLGRKGASAVCTAQGVLGRFCFLSWNSGRTSKGHQPPDKGQCPCPFLLGLAFLSPTEAGDVLHLSHGSAEVPMGRRSSEKGERADDRAETWTVVVILSWFAVAKY